MSDVAPTSAGRSDADVRKAVFRIQTRRQTGTGFLVLDQQHILTARHVIEGIQIGQEKVTVRNVSTNKEYTAFVQKPLENWDVALLRLDKPIEDSQIKPFDLAQQKPSPRNFSTYGFPDAYGPEWFYGNIGNEEDDGKYVVNFEASYNPRDANTLEGLSGGPIFYRDDHTFVIGIIIEHGPVNYSLGKIVPTAGFYKEIADAIAAEVIEEPAPWCYVILSEMEESVSDRLYTLEQAVRDALENDQGVQSDEKRLEFVRAARVVSNKKEYMRAVKNLCKARVAIFDITNYEPVVMLLLGIRSVVRRGVNIASGGDFVIGEPIDFPFNIKEMNIISHSEKQHNEKKEPARIIREKIDAGLRQLEALPQYLDMPTFDSIRNLPPDYRKPDPDEVLVLCPYSKQYQDIHWGILQSRLGISLTSKEKIVRVLDLMSPRLVSNSIYEAIRRKVLCIVDLTEWRPNVLFELGVRLAVTKPGGFTVCIIEGRHRYLLENINEKLLDEVKEIKKKPAKEEPTEVDRLVREFGGVDTDDPAKFKSISNRYAMMAEQCERLMSLFDPLIYNLPASDKVQVNEDLDKRFQTDWTVFKAMMYHYAGKEKDRVAPEKDGCVSNLTYEVIENKIDLEGEITSVPVYLELLRTSELFRVDDTEGQASVLYPGNPTLKRRVDSGYHERLLAAWYFISKQYSEEYIMGHEKLSGVRQDIARKLLLSPLFEVLNDSNSELVRELRRVGRSREDRKGDTNERKTSASETSQG